jgi:hypothetical protein
MFNAKFDFDASHEHATKVAEKVTEDKDSHDAIVKALCLRDAAGVRMSRAEPFSEAWNQASKDIVVQECVLAPWGLV